METYYIALVIDIWSMRHEVVIFFQCLLFRIEWIRSDPIQSTTQTNKQSNQLHNTYTTHTHIVTVIQSDCRLS